MKGGHNRIKDNTTDYKCLDILTFQREGKLTEEGKGYYQTYWTNRATGKQVGSINVYTTPDYMRLIFTTTDNFTGEKQDYDYGICIDWTPCNYGGHRAWFVCPGCNSNVRKLYVKRGTFLCRKCHNLNYYSQQLSKSDRYIETMNEQIFRIQKKLQTKETYFIPKPKGMHWATYERLKKSLKDLEEEKNQRFVSVCIQRFGLVI